MKDAGEAHPRDPRRFRVTGRRFVLWIDGVGGYLVCEDDEVWLGQAAPGNRVDVPILGDLSRQHAVIRRDAEGYLIEPLRPLVLDGRTVERTVPLADGSVVEVGRGVRLRLGRPHPLSATARLDFLSRHRTEPAVDGVLLLAEACVLGPGRQSHVVCGQWKQEVMLVRSGATLFCHSAGRLEIDGKPASGRGVLTRQSRVVGDGFSLSLEPLS